VRIVAGEYPDIEINEKAIAAYIADALGLDKGEREDVRFPGTVSLVIENLGGAEIRNSMTDASTAPKTEPDSDADVDLSEGGAADAM
jgi:hypothetical protein